MVKKDNRHPAEQLIDDFEAAVEFVQLGDSGRQVIIIGVEQIGRDSQGEVNRFIDEGWADTACFDLDDSRERILADQEQWESLTIGTVIKEKLLTALLLNLLLSAYQRKFDRPATSMPGDEIYAALEEARKHSLPTVLVDRDLHLTYSRASKSVNFITKIRMFFRALVKLVRYKKISNAAAEELLTSDPMSAFLDEVTSLNPDLNEALIEERDQYSAQKIIDVAGNQVLAVVGAGRIEGIRRCLNDSGEVDLEELEREPETSTLGKWAKILIPIVLVIGLFYLGLSQGKEFIRENLAFWIAANSLLTGLGAILAGAHILAILTAVIVAPFSPLIPAGPGTVAAVVQFFVRPPLVNDFQTFADDIGQPLRWRKNRILKIVLIMVFCGIGSILGTLLGTSRILFSIFSLE